jgi:hypothetical protein
VEGIDNSKNCNWTKIQRFTDADVLAAVSKLLREPVRVVLLAAICENQPHPEMGVHQMVVICGEGNRLEANFLIAELQEAIFK